MNGEEEDELSVDPKRRKNYRLIYERERRKAQCRLPKPEPNAEYQCRALLLAMGAVSHRLHARAR